MTDYTLPESVIELIGPRDAGTVRTMLLLGHDSVGSTTAATTSPAFLPMLFRYARLAARERLASWYRGRACRPVRLLPLRTNRADAVHLNLVNGTAVVVERNVVRKLYYRHIDLHKDVLSALTGLSGIKITRTTANVLETSQPRFRVSRTESSLTQVRDAIADFQRQATPRLLSASKRISIHARAQLIADNYHGLGAPLRTAIDRLGVSLATRIAHSDVPTAVCHGDVWRANLAWHNATLQLLDFDKVVWAPRAFDLVHYVLMGASWPSILEPALIRRELESASREILHNAGVRDLSFDEIRLSILCFLYLKLVERLAATGQGTDLLEALASYEEHWC